MDCPDLRAFFPHAKVLREVDGDTALCDPEYSPWCGYASFREAALLFQIARACRGRWLEIGSHTGWTAAHIAAAGCSVVALDPDYSGPMLSRATGNLTLAGIIDRVELSAGLSGDFFKAYRGEAFDGVFIDGCHSAPGPLDDARGALATLKPTGVIVFHDWRGQPVKDGVEYLRAQGLNVREWLTMNGLAVCWRGELEMPA